MSQSPKATLSRAPSAHHQQERLGVRQFLNYGLTICELDGKIALPVDSIWDWLGDTAEEVTVVLGNKTVVSLYYRICNSDEQSDTQSFRIVAHRLHQPGDSRRYTCASYEYDGDDNIVSGGMIAEKHGSYEPNVISIGPQFRYGESEPSWVVTSTDGHIMPLARNVNDLQFSSGPMSGSFLVHRGPGSTQIELLWQKEAAGWRGEDILTIRAADWGIAPALTLLDQERWLSAVHLIQFADGSTLLLRDEDLEDDE